MAAATVPTQTNTFEPSSDLIQEEECDTLLLYLPGFTKEQLRVQLSKSGFLKVSGTRPVGENKLSSFQKDFPISKICDASKISAKFEGGILYIRQPKLIVPAKNEETGLPARETPRPQKAEESKATRTDQEQANTQKINANNDKVKQNTLEEHLEKSFQEEPKSTNKEEKVISKNEDHKAKPEMSTEEHKKVQENSISEFMKRAGMQNPLAKLSGPVLNEGAPATKLKKARKMMNVVLVMLVAFGLGMYFSNFISRPNEPKI